MQKAVISKYDQWDDSTLLLMGLPMTLWIRVHWSNLLMKAFHILQRDMTIETGIWSYEANSAACGSWCSFSMQL